MDVLAGLLDGPRARGAFLLRALMQPPWSMRILDEAPLTLIAIVRGEAWIATDDGEAVHLGAGDIAVATGPDPYLVSDTPGRTPDIVVYPGQACRSLSGEPLEMTMRLGVRTWGNDPDSSTVMLIGAYESLGEISQSLLSSLPPLLTLARDQWDTPLIPLLNDEVAKDEPGQSAVLDRLLDLLLIAALRAWFIRNETEAPGWYRAAGDPIVGPVLHRIHDRLDAPWTVARLAAEAGLSRAALAKRFHTLVGKPPMTYVTERRLALAADLLREPGATVASVAPQVGYGSPFALSTAFKRQRGITPQEHRAAANPKGPGVRPIRPTP